MNLILELNIPSCSLLQNAEIFRESLPHIQKEETRNMITILLLPT